MVWKHATWFGPPSSPVNSTKHGHDIMYLCILQGNDVKYSKVQAKASAHCPLLTVDHEFASNLHFQRVNSIAVLQGTGLQNSWAITRNRSLLKGNYSLQIILRLLYEMFSFKQNVNYIMMKK